MTTDAEILKRYREAVERGELNEDGELQIDGEMALSLVPRYALSLLRHEAEELRREVDHMKTAQSIEWFEARGHFAELIGPESEHEGEVGQAHRLGGGVVVAPAGGMESFVGYKQVSFFPTVELQSWTKSPEDYQAAILKEAQRLAARLNEQNVTPPHRPPRAKPAVASPGALRHRRRTSHSGA